MARKLFVLTLIVLIASSAFSLIGVESVKSSNVPVPQFTVQYINASYDYTTSPSTDPYTGASIPPVSYHVDHSYIQVSFENNKLPTTPADSHSEYYYNIRYKGQYTDDWIEARTASDGYYRPSVFKTINFTLPAFSVTGQQLPDGTKIDFQVQLMYGGIGKDLSEGPLGSLYFVGETSGWSSTQTVTIGDSQPTQTTQTSPAPTQASATQNPTSTSSSSNSQQPNAENGFPLGLNWEKIAIIVLVIAVTALAIVVFWQRKKGGRTMES